MFSFVAPKHLISHSLCRVIIYLKCAAFTVCHSACFHSQPAAADPGLCSRAPCPAAAKNPGAISGTGCGRGITPVQHLSTTHKQADLSQKKMDRLLFYCKMLNFTVFAFATLVTDIFSVYRLKQKLACHVARDALKS